MENPSKWYLRKHMRWIGFLLIILGLCMAIAFFPIMPILAVFLLALIAGSGVFIGCKRKSARKMLFGALLMVSWGYAFGVFILSARVEVANEFYLSWLFPTMIPVAIAVAPLAWYGRWKTSQYGSFKNALFTYATYMMIVAPLVFSGMYDYNVRADTSPPEVVSMIISDKYVDHGGILTLTVKSLDGRFTFFLEPSEEYYVLHDVGDFCQASAHEGALGCMWVEGYG